MGIYYNPGNESFAQAKRSQIYIDKSRLLNILNKRLSTENKCIAVSHARRFGKSHAAGMIDAYYSCGCNSADLFEDTLITECEDYKKYLNKYNVIHLDISSVWDFHKKDLTDFVHDIICEDLKKVFGGELDCTKELYLLFHDIYTRTGKQFVIIVDEWDCVIRNSDDSEVVHEYLQFLHSIFKSEESKAFLALAYITGILPIKKVKDESALNNFSEYTMLRSNPITEYFGFTETEVEGLCERFDMDMEATKAWYDGYLIDGKHMYNPNSVVQSMLNRDYDSYWKNTSSYSSINTFINMNFDGLKSDILAMLSGEKIYVDTEMFQNDLSMVGSKDEALTALIHLGYLAYDREDGSSYIPNYEVKKAFQAALNTGNWGEISKVISRCDELLRATWAKDSDKVAEIIEQAHDTYTSILKYNDENSLSCVLTMAYFTAPAYYNLVREMPAGKGFADFVFIPRANAGTRPAMIVELKYNKDAEGAIRQIREKRYKGALEGYSGRILLVGINYNSKEKERKHHTCVIEELNQDK